MIASGLPAREHRVGRIGTSRQVADVDARLPEHAALRGLVHCAMVEEQRRRLDRLHGRPAASVDPAFEWHPGAEDRGITLGQLVERFTADRAPRLGRSKLLEYGLLFRALSELWGDDKPAREVTREDCRQVRDLLASLPPNATKRWPRLTLRQAAERARERP